MVLEMGQLCESLGADPAGEGFLPRVDELMSLKLGGGGELLAAIRTLMPPIVTVAVIGPMVVGRAGNLEVKRYGQKGYVWLGLIL